MRVVNLLPKLEYRVKVDTIPFSVDSSFTKNDKRPKFSEWVDCETSHQIYEQYRASGCTDKDIKFDIRIKKR